MSPVNTAQMVAHILTVVGLPLAIGYVIDWVIQYTRDAHKK